MNLAEMLAHQGVVAWVVLGVLALMSLFVWAAIVSKALSFRRSERGYDRLRRAIFERRQFQEIRAWCWDQEGNPYARVVLDAAGELEETGGRPAGDDRLWKLQKEMLERSLLQGLRREATRGTRWMPLLATAGNVSPFIGLFGTVWGIMKSFREIGLEKSASLAVVAPGISEALLATAAGLFAAIPAVIAYNHFRARLAAQNARMSDVIAEVLNLLERERLEEDGALQQGRPTLLGSDPRREQGEG